MLNRTRLFLSGHGDLFPTSKSAAHLTPRWVLNRPVPPRPGKGECYASFTYPQHHSRYQFVRPEMHETKVVPIGEVAGMHYCVTQRPSEHAARAAVAGVTAEMSHKVAKTNDTPLARATIAAKAASEELAMTRDWHSRLPPLQPKKGYEVLADYCEAERDVELNTLDCCMGTGGSNPSGHSKKWFAHEYNPPAKPAPPAPRK